MIRRARRGTAHVEGLWLVVTIALASITALGSLGRAFSVDLMGSVAASRPQVSHAASAALLGVLGRAADVPPRVVPLKARELRNVRRFEFLDASKDLAEAQARLDVHAWTEDEFHRNRWRPEQAERAANERADDLFDRHVRREREAEQAVERLIQLEKHATDAQDWERVRHLRTQQEELLYAARLNRKLGTERSAIPKLRRFVQVKFPRLAAAIGWGRDSQFSPGLVASDIGAVHDLTARTDHLDPIHSTVWTPPPAGRTGPDVTYHGAHFAPGEAPTVPSKQTQLVLHGLRSYDADGGHPSVVVRDPTTDTRWKLKFTPKETFVSPEVVKGRLYERMGWTTQATYRTPELTVEPGAVLAAFDRMNRIGVRVREGGLLDRLGVRPGKYGIGQYKMRDHIKAVTLKNGDVIDGKEAHAHLRRAARDSDTFDGIESVTVSNTTLTYKGDNGLESIGPFDPDAPRHVDQRAVRAIGVIEAWFGGDDIRFNNLKQLVAFDDNDDFVRIVDSVSDTGSGLSPGDLNRLPWEVDLDLGRLRVHPDQNRYSLRAFDRMTPDDARWGVRQVAKLSEDEIFAAAVAGTDSHPAARYLTAKLISRRNSMVEKAGLADEFPTRHVDRQFIARSHATLHLRDRHGRVVERIAMPAGDHEVIRGELVPNAPRPDLELSIR